LVVRASGFWSLSPPSKSTAAARRSARALSTGLERVWQNAQPNVIAMVQTNLISIAAAVAVVSTVPPEKQGDLSITDVMRIAKRYKADAISSTLKRNLCPEAIALIKELGLDNMAYG
jgi:hypothetical protein